MREYRIYLPLKYNDGTAVEEEKFRNIKTALVGLPLRDDGKHKEPVACLWK